MVPNAQQVFTVQLEVGLQQQLFVQLDTTAQLVVLHPHHAVQICSKMKQAALHASIALPVTIALQLLLLSVHPNLKDKITIA